jgi:cyclic pyranopterin monophosphate synthase
VLEAKLFEFDAIDGKLDLVPLAARRLLDGLGAKLSLEGWRSLPLEHRRQLVVLGSGDTFDATEARSILALAFPAPRDTDAIGDPESKQVPSRLTSLLDPTRPLGNDAWAALSALERWVLDKVTKSKDPSRLPAAYDEIVARRRSLSHLNAQGDVTMVDVTAKQPTPRRAVASSRVVMSEQAHRLLVDGNAPKGDVLAAARIAGIMAAKQTSQLIPLCHPIRLSGIEVEVVASRSEPSVDIRAEVFAIDRTGVEMEALVAASVAALTLYDMLKAVDRAMVIGPIRLLEKSGGKSGEYRA